MTYTVALGCGIESTRLTTDAGAQSRFVFPLRAACDMPPAPATERLPRHRWPDRHTRVGRRSVLVRIAKPDVSNIVFSDIYVRGTEPRRSGSPARLSDPSPMNGSLPRPSASGGSSLLWGVTAVGACRPQEEAEAYFAENTSPEPE